MDEKTKDAMEEIEREAHSFSPGKEWRKLAAMAIVVMREIRDELTAIKNILGMIRDERKDIPG